MRRLFPLSAATCLTVLIVLASAVVASAATPLQEYQRTGHITPCKYTSGQLGGQVPNDVEQYAPEYKSQLEAAGRQRARGCGGSSGGSSGGGAAGGGGSGAGSGGSSSAAGSKDSTGSGARPVVPPPAPPIDPAAADTGAGAAPPAVTTGSDDGGISTSLLVLLILGGLVVLGGLLALVGRYLGWSAGWLRPPMHALREARMRIGTTAGGLADWARPAPRSS